MSAAGERQKRLRARQRDGLVVVPVVVSHELIEELIDRGWIAAEESEDRRRLAEAVADMLADLLNLQSKNSVTRHGGRR